MPEISPLGPGARPRLVSSSQFVDDQISVVRRRVAAAVEKGGLSGDDAAAIVRRLDQIQREIDAGAATASLSRSALRRTSEELHAINRQVAQAIRPAAAPKPTIPGRLDITA
jgi:hypothetical protein